MPALSSESTAFDLTQIGAGLPVADNIAQLPELLPGSDCPGPRSGQTLVVQAPPGTGKTTLIPPALANHTGGKVLVTAPRRVAVRAAARRLAQLDGSPLGQRVGYAIRGDARPGQLVEFVTPGVLLRRLLQDPSLEGISAVAIDEVHERQVDSDLVLGMCLELTELREDFSVIAMSATLDAARFAELMNAPTLTTPAITHPLETEYRPHPGRAEGTPEFYRHVAELAREGVERSGHSALVFVPGVREVDSVCRHLPGALPLHGRLSNEEQDAALKPSSTPRIIVATSIAESSLTVPGVRVVVDTGLSRVPRRDAARQMTGLVTVTAAKSTADQRAGRAGREGPGLVMRAYAAADYHHAAGHISPEITTSDLTQAALWMASWGTPGGVGLPLPDAPPTSALDDAHGVLASLGALDEHGAITATGRHLATLPLHPRLGRALVACGPSAAPVVAALADSPSGDINRAQPSRGEVKRLEALVPSARGPWVGTREAGTITGLAFPQRIARQESESEYLLASGTRAFLPPDSPLRGAQWLAIAEVTRSTARAGRAGATIRAAARIDQPTALDIIGISEQTTASVSGGKVHGRLRRSAGAIELSTTPVKVDPDQASAALAAGIRSTGLKMFSFSPAAQSLRDRLNFLHARLGEPWPEVESADPEYWLGPELDAIAHGAAADSFDMLPALQRLLPWPEANELETLAPAKLAVPSGSQPRISYAEGRPVVRVKLQECFGLASSPECAGVRVQFHLLSPAGRPLAVTDDLASFWSGPYAGVRAEMRGRYPKHPWPEDPWSAPATARTKNRMSSNSPNQ